MRRCFVPVLFLLAATIPNSHAAQQPPPEQLTTLQWRINLDPQGKVSELVASGEGIDALRQRLEPVIRKWEFVPGAVDGKPMATQTLLSVQLRLRLSADGSEFAVRIKNARTGGSVAKATVGPRISSTAVGRLLRSQDPFQAQVVVEVRYDAAGKALAVTPTSGSPVQDGPLLEGVRKAAKRWTYQPERIAGVGVPGTVLVPVCFYLSSDAAKARPQAADCRWTQPGTQISVDEGDSLALDSTVRLKTNIDKGLL